MGSSSADAPPGRCVAFWTAREVPSGAISIPSEVDAIAKDLRAEYCRWAHDAGAALVGKRTVRSHLAFWPNLSMWWMGLIAEKEPLKSAGVYTVFKLRTLEKIYGRMQCCGLVYVGGDLVLHNVLEAWAKQMGHPYRHVPAEDRPTVDHSKHPRLRRLPSPLQGLGYLALKCWSRYRFVRRRPAPGFPGRKRATIVTYFPNIDLERTATGRFWSRYWERVHELLDEAPYPITWIWLYVDSQQASYADAIRLRDVCNAAGRDKYEHFLIDDFVSPSVIWRACRVYAKSCAAAFSLRRVRSAFAMPGSALNFFPILKRDWDSSLTGIAAMDGALSAELWSAASSVLGASAWTMYIWENQAWEHALLAAWQRAGNGPTVGVQHATLPPLDLRACIDPREVEAPLPERRPVPDRLAVNGCGARDFLKEVDFPNLQVVVTEAVRYGRLASLMGAPAAHAKTLLVVTGYKRSDAFRQIALLKDAAAQGAMSGYTRVLIKPHPICPIEPLLADAGIAVPYTLVHEPLSLLWPETGVAFVANSTSAVAEALHLKIPTAVCAPDDEMNLSPAFGHPGVPMITSAAELTAFLKAPAAAEWPANYLLIDSRLDRWRTLLTA